MRKYHALNCRRRPTVDPLESRCLLSGRIEVIEVAPPPALVIGIEFRQALLPVNGFGSLTTSTITSGSESGMMSGFHHDFSPTGVFYTPDLGFRPYSDPLLVSKLVSPISESENAAESTPNAESTGAFPGPPNHGDVPPGSPPPSQTAFMLFLSGESARIPHFLRDLATRPAPDETTLDSAQDTSQDDEVTVSPAADQSAVQAQGGNSIGQIAPPVIVSPGNLTALFKPELEHDGRSIQIERSGETPGKQPVEAVSVNLPISDSANLVTTGDSATDGPALRGDEVSASVVDPMLSGNHTKLLLPQAAGLIANAVPFDQAALEKAVDQFFDQLESLGIGQLVEQGPTRVIPLSLALLGTVTAVEVARRRLKSRTGERKAAESQNPLTSEELLGYPELPGSWSTNLT